MSGRRLGLLSRLVRHANLPQKVWIRQSGLSPSPCNCALSEEALLLCDLCDYCEDFDRADDPPTVGETELRGTRTVGALVRLDRVEMVRQVGEKSTKEERVANSAAADCLVFLPNVGIVLGLRDSFHVRFVCGVEVSSRRQIVLATNFEFSAKSGSVVRVWPAPSLVAMRREAVGCGKHAEECPRVVWVGGMTRDFRIEEM